MNPINPNETEFFGMIQIDSDSFGLKIRVDRIDWIHSIWMFGLMRINRIRSDWKFGSCLINSDWPDSVGLQSDWFRMGLGLTGLTRFIPKWFEKFRISAEWISIRNFRQGN